MNIEEELARRSRRGKPRGADAVFDGAVSDQTRQNDFESRRSTVRNPTVRHSWSGSRIVASAACIAAAGVAAALLLSRQPSDEETATAPATVLSEVTTTQTTNPTELGKPEVEEPQKPSTTVTGGDAEKSSSFLASDYRIDGRSVDEFSVQAETGDRWTASVSRAGHGSVFVRPDQAFTAVDNMIVIEADVAAGREEYNQDTWVELIATTGSQPDDSSQIFGQDYFENETSIGCRIEATHNVHCSQKVPDNPDASWSASWFDQVGRDSFGGNDTVDNRQHFRHCDEGADPEGCLDRFRLEITSNRLTLYVNGLRYFEQSNFESAKQLSDDILNGEFFVYAVSTYTPRSSEQIRFDWGKLTVNPTTGPTASPYFQ